MKILFMVGSLAGGGAERVVSELANEMAKKDNEVNILTVASSKRAYSISQNINVIDCSQRDFITGLNFFKRIRKIRQSIKLVKPDVVISFTVSVNIYAVLSCIGLQTKLILAERNDPRYDPSDKMTRVLRSLLYPLADNYVFQTNGEKEFFSKRIQKRSVVIPNPVNPNLPKPYEGERDKRFVTAARLVPQKNLEMAIDAFEGAIKKHPEYVFEIYGEGPLKDKLQNYIEQKSLQKNVLLKGRSDDLYNDINSANGFILSSNYEGISNSMIEAMALGIPTISTDYPSGGARELIKDHENGILIPVNDKESLRKYILELIEDKKVAKTISDHSVNIRTLLNIDNIISMWQYYIESWK